MPLRPDLLEDIHSRLTAIGNLNLTTADAVFDIFEAFIFGLVLDAASREGAAIWYETVSGRAATDLLFRTSPGRVFPADPPAVSVPYTHAVIEFAGKPSLELHQGIYVSGKSGLLHEADVAVILRTEGQTCRRERVSPRCTKMILGAECKCYSSGLGISVGRGFIGLTSDLRCEGRFFVANTSSGSVNKLLTHHSRPTVQDVVPRNTIVVNRLRALFEQVFAEFKAIN